MELIAFYILSGIAIIASLGVVAQRNPMRSVLFTTYSFAFEVTSILILVAMVGAVVIAGKPRSEH
jgi:NADH:ubiquinone oxidoreductase subunit 6 (subunit J)